MRKQTQTDCLMSMFAAPEPRSAYRVPESIFQMSASKTSRSFCSLDRDFQRAFSTSWLKCAGLCRCVGQLSEKAERKRGPRVGRYLLEGLFSSVGSDVVVERGGASKGTATVAALERPVTGVSDHVVPQFRRLGKGLGAVAALVGPETEKAAAWSLSSMVGSGNQHPEAGTKTFWWHLLRFYNRI